MNESQYKGSVNGWESCYVIRNGIKLRLCDKRLLERSIVNEREEVKERKEVNLITPPTGGEKQKITSE